MVSDAQVYPRRQCPSARFGRDAAWVGGHRPASRAPPARDRLAETTSPIDEQALLGGWRFAHRELGDLLEARESLEHARRLADTTGDVHLRARITVSLAFEVGHGGDIPAALLLLAGVVDEVADDDRPLLAIQRGILNYRLGRLDDAIADLAESRAVRGGHGRRRRRAQGAREPGHVRVPARRVRRGGEHLLAAVTLGFELGQLAWASFVSANLVYVETVEGNLPEALDACASAEDGMRETGTQSELPRLYADHAAALADANLLDDAEHLIDRAVGLSAASGNGLEHAELLLVSAEIDLAKGKPDEAHVSAVDAVAVFTRQGRESWLHVAERLRLRAEALLTPDEPGIAEGLVMNGRALAAGGWRSDALSSTLLAALLYVERDRLDDARTLLAEVGSDVSAGAAPTRSCSVGSPRCWPSGQATAPPREEP